MMHFMMLKLIKFEVQDLDMVINMILLKSKLFYQI